MGHLLKLPTDPRFTKDIMKSIWSVGKLQQRSVKGQASRRFAKVEAVAKQALTPGKAAAMKNALSYYVYQNPNPMAVNLQEGHAVRVGQMNIMRKFLSDLGHTAL
ncbi:uncharacterized protein LOC120844756 [Ixodes scapularis]|uniref:uncharacterized protein LOC120844756 n=1 Tax=Ixodes scapularis TaxID=6945 RepID=UPI001C38C408|nr:uncharacterized protein LOC120844756 [Ixodes scapularis]